MARTGRPSTPHPQSFLSATVGTDRADYPRAKIETAFHTNWTRPKGNGSSSGPRWAARMGSPRSGSGAQGDIDWVRDDPGSYPPLTEGSNQVDTVSTWRCKPSTRMLTLVDAFAPRRPKTSTKELPWRTMCQPEMPGNWALSPRRKWQVDSFWVWTFFHQTVNLRREVGSDLDGA